MPGEASDQVHATIPISSAGIRPPSKWSQIGAGHRPPRRVFEPDQQLCIVCAFLCPRAFTPSAFAHVSPGFARQLAMRKPAQLSNLSTGQSLGEEENCIPTAPGRARAGRESSRDNCQDDTDRAGQGPVRFLIPGAGAASSCPLLPGAWQASRTGMNCGVSLSGLPGGQRRL